MTTISHLKPGTILTNKEISQTFKCPFEGGMRWSLKTNALVLVTNPLISPYGNQWDGKTLHFIGMGKTGDQQLSKQNKTLYEMESNGIKVYYFNLLKPTQYTYIGEMKKASDPYQRKVKDAQGHLRKVWVFPLKRK